MEKMIVFKHVEIDMDNLLNHIQDMISDEIRDCLLNEYDITEEIIVSHVKKKIIENLNAD